MSDLETYDFLEDLHPPSSPTLFTEEELKDVGDDEHHENETGESGGLVEVRNPALHQGIPPSSHWIMTNDVNYLLMAKHTSDLHPVPVTVNDDVTAPSVVGFDTVCDQNERVEGDDPYRHANISNSELCQPASTTEEADAVKKDGQQKRSSRKTPLGSRSVEEAGTSFSTGGGETSEVPSARRSKRSKRASKEESEDEGTSAPPPKLYKYQLDTPDAKAAKASKATRDKKKAELEEAKATIEEMKGTIAYLKNKLEESERLKEEFRQQIESSRLLNQEGPQVRQKALAMLRLSLETLSLVGTPVNLFTTTIEHPEASANDGVGSNEPN